MASEYEPKMDADKTVPILPRPLKRVDQRIRALNKTGDASGSSPTDDMMFWQGLDKQKYLAIQAEDLARFYREQAIDNLWG